MRNLSFISLMLLSLVSCNKTTIDNTEKTIFVYHSRECNYAWVGHAKQVKLEDAPVKDTYIIESLTGTSEVSVKNYLLSINSCNIDKTDISDEDWLKYFNTTDRNSITVPLFIFLRAIDNPRTNSPDLDIERIIKQVNNQGITKGASSMPQANIEHVDYRISKLTGLKITCNKTLFGVNSGESLNDYIELFDFPVYHNFIISSNKQLVASDSRDIKGMSVGKYLNYQPYAPAMIFFKFKSIPIETPIEVMFSIELEIDGTKVITDTSKAVNLLSD